jgi:SusD family.
MKYPIFKYLLLITGLASVQLSCKKFLEIDPPKDSLIKQTIFKSEETATSALLGIYSNMASSGYACGGYNSVTALCGLSADELIAYTALTDFYQNQLNPATANISSGLWQRPYIDIYAANTLIEGLGDAPALSEPVKARLLGESLFIRAFSYFYLVNLFGPVPLHLGTDYRANEKAARTPVKEVYEQILTDLKTAEPLLTVDYPGTERTRPNLFAVRALLARTYLFLEDWQQAAQYASLVIDEKQTYDLVPLDEVFLKNSKEAIWQLMPAAGENTREGNLFILTAVPTEISLTNAFVSNGFEAIDRRRKSWISTFSSGTDTYYYPSKYKVRSSATISEYSMVLRLAEQHLIRAEARAQLNQIKPAIEDLDLIRERAGLEMIEMTHPGIDQQDLLEAIQKERRNELFCEWGHRWLDLKRTGQADAVLGSIKADWSSTDKLYPIPQTEINLNHNVTQNEGY